MTIYRIDPLTDCRWEDLVSRHPYSSNFHSAEWLQSLQRTYRFVPVAFTLSSPNEPLTNAIVFTHIQDWIRGRRLVSLPFSDHCDPLVNDATELAELMDGIRSLCQQLHYKEFEMRPLRPAGISELGHCGMGASANYLFHHIQLQDSAEQTFRRFDKDCVQRRIARAQRAGLTYEEGRSDRLLDAFYFLMLKTRRKHQLPPQPLLWFRNLLQCAGNFVTIHVAYKNSAPAAAIMTFRWKDTLVYKYGGSDPSLANLGGTPLVLWRAIEMAHRDHLRQVDLGRCEPENTTLATFKERWGAERRIAQYWKYPAPHEIKQHPGFLTKIAKSVFAHLPDRMLIATGKTLYRYMA